MRWAARILPVVLGLVTSVSVDAEVEITCHHGFDGQMAPDTPTPLTLRITNRSPTLLEGTLEVVNESGLGFEAWRVERQVEVSVGATRQLTLLVPGVTGADPVLRVSTVRKRSFSAVDPDGDVVRASDTRRLRIPLGNPDPLVASPAVLALGDRGRQLRGALPRKNGVNALHLGGRHVEVATLDVDLAPDTWIAYSGFSVILWTEPDLSRLPDPAQLRALKEWVEFGGRLVVLSAARSLLLEDPQLAAMLPAKAVILDLRPYPSPPSWEGAFDQDLPVLTVSPRDGAVDASAAGASWLAGLPVALEWNLGEGRIALARFDPLRYDLGNAHTLAAALARAAGVPLGYRTPRSLRGDSASGSLAGWTFFDLLANHNVLTPPLGLFIFLGIVFVVLIGPIDYYMLKRHRRLSWSPWTLLGYTVLFSATSIGATYVLFASNEEVNRIAILDFTDDHEGSESIHGFLYHGIYAPYGGTYWAAVPEYQSFGSLVRPRPEYRGIVLEAGGPDAARGFQVCRGPGTQPLVLRLPFNSLRVVAQRISGRPEGSLSVDLEREGEGALLTVGNHLAHDLHDAILGTPEGLFYVGRLPAGESVTHRINSLARPGEQRGGLMWYRRLTMDIPEHFSFWFNKERQEPGEPPSKAVMASLQLASIEEWSGATAREFEGIPWSLRLGRNRAALLAFTEDLPFRDALADAPGGFTWVLVRKVVDLPAPAH